jgi:hypothetical protein
LQQQADFPPERYQRKNSLNGSIYYSIHCFQRSWAIPFRSLH